MMFLIQKRMYYTMQTIAYENKLSLNVFTDSKSEAMIISEMLNPNNYNSICQCMLQCR